jgi:hypothetical protein
VEEQRRVSAFMEIWRDTLPILKQEVQMSHEEINQLV